MTPNDNPPEAWDEFQWELALRDGDEYAARYFRLLQRFCDLPDSEELITEQLEKEIRQKFPDCDFHCETCPHRWECQYANVQDWDAGGFDEEDIENDADGDGEEEDRRRIEPGDPLYYETTPVFITLRQTAMGWCNVYAAVLPQEARSVGLKILCHIGRALAYVSYSVGDGLYEQPGASIAFGKRALGQINAAIGRLLEMTRERPRLEPLTAAVRRQLFASREAVIELLDACRQHRDGDSDAKKTDDGPN